MQFNKKKVQYSTFSLPCGTQLIIYLINFVIFNRESNKLKIFVYFPNIKGKIGFIFYFFRMKGKNWLISKR